MLSTISTAFAHTRCISPSVCLLKSLMQASTFAPSPLTARASAIRSRTCGRQRLAFLAVSANGGARKPNPSEGRRGRCRAVHRFTAVRPTFSLFTLTFYLRRQPHWGSQEPRLVTPLQVLTKKRTGKTCALLFVLCSFYESTFALRSGWRLIAAWQLFMISASVTLYFSIMDATLAVSLRMSTTTTCS